MINYRFDFKLGDEAHHLVGFDNDEKMRGFRKFHKISATKTLYMTATEKIIETDFNYQVNDKNLLFTMDDIKIFGEILDYKYFKWAIDNKKITDFNLLLIENNEYDILNILDNPHGIIRIMG